MLASVPVTAPLALEPLEPLRDDLASAAVLCDLDGSLAHIAARPEEVELPEEARGLVRRLTERGTLVAFISGRSVHDLMRIVDVPELAYAGNHGMEIRRQGSDPAPPPEAAAYVPAISAFADEWARRLEEHGVWVEDKAVTLSLHFRGAADPAAAERYLGGVVAPAAREAGLVPTRGRKILEIRPPVQIDKGSAVRALLEGAAVGTAVSVGDDHTDVGAWRELRALRDEGRLATAVTVGVLRPEVPEEIREGADVLVDGPEGAVEVLRFLVGYGRQEAGRATH
jgi:trehalose 6-phosphate phosphatase